MKLPRLNLDHLVRLTDDTGIVQFAKFGVGDSHSGYATDDNARALIVAARLPNSPLRDRLASVYLSFLLSAQQPDGTLAHLAAYDRSLSDAPASDDGLGRCLWACAEVVASNLPAAMKQTAAFILDRAWPHLDGIRHVRGWANALQGLALQAHFAEDGRARQATEACADRLLEHLDAHTVGAWVWFEQILTYEPGRMPLGLLYATAILGKSRNLEVAERVLGFLEQTLFDQAEDGRIFVPVGNGGWYPRGGRRAVYDQQPVDAASMVEAYAAAAAITGQAKYRRLACAAFAWFLGKNSCGVPVYDPDTGACRDGLHPHGANLNAGAESTLCFLLARLTISSRTLPISRLPGARKSVPASHAARRGGGAQEHPEPIWPPGPPSAASLRGRPSPRR